jgi:hypothetical protein
VPSEVASRSAVIRSGAVKGDGVGSLMSSKTTEEAYAVSLDSPAWGLPLASGVSISACAVRVGARRRLLLGLAQPTHRGETDVTHNANA